MNGSVLAGLMCLCVATIASAADRDSMSHGKLTEPGQAVSAALAEAIAALESDPTTDWAKVDVTSLRDHLLDMDEVMMRSTATVETSGNIVRVTYTGAGRTLAAIQRMIPAHGAMMEGFKDWRTSTALRPDGATWTIVTDDAQQRDRIRAYGAYGLLTLGSHHLVHHLAIASGAHPHSFRPHP